MGWTKYYIDGSKYTATDEDISLKRASWRTSRSEGMVGADHDGLSIRGHGEYWQSETMVASFPLGCPKVIQRRLQKKIDPNDSVMAIYMEHSHSLIEIHKKFPVDIQSSIVPIPGNLVGKWLTLEHDLENNQIHYYFSDTKL